MLHLQTRSHAGNRRPRSHRGFSVAFANGFSLVSGIFQRVVTFPVDCYWKSPMDVQWHSPMDFHISEFWCGIFCPKPGRRGGTPKRRGDKSRRSYARGPQARHLWTRTSGKFPVDLGMPPLENQAAGDLSQLRVRRRGAAPPPRAPPRRRRSGACGRACGRACADADADAGNRIRGRLFQR